MLGYSIREISKFSKWSKSTIHNDLKKLAAEEPETYGKYIIDQLSKNFASRGTKGSKYLLKYLKERRQKTVKTPKH